MARTFSNPRMTAVRLPVTLRTEEIVAGLNNLQPDFMTVYPSVLHALAHETAAGRLRIGPRRVLAGAEPLLPEIRAAAEQAWGVNVINIYGTSEGGGTAVGCDRGSTHISEDQLIVEPVDLRAMAAAVRPGGWLLAEDADYCSLVAADPARPRSPRFDAVMRTLLSFIAAGDGVVGAGEFETVLAALRDPSFTFVDALYVAAWGQIPGPGTDRGDRTLATADAA
jgi:hypothetical protein